jgi:hypothetical protein
MGVNRGFMTFRWLDSHDQTVAKPKVKLIKISEL